MKRKMSAVFKLDPRLAEGTCFVEELDLSSLLLMNDLRFPWLVLVPRVPNITEIYQLEWAAQQQLWKEITSVSQQASLFFKADKMNIATLGNIVPQLHIHIIARKHNDVEWPKAVWGGNAIPYSEEQQHALIKEIRSFNWTIN
jgi:diadenosine tetraphosphate (Ap4A) HIT family hydrolase